MPGGGVEPPRGQPAQGTSNTRIQPQADLETRRRNEAPMIIFRGIWKLRGPARTHDPRPRRPDGRSTSPTGSDRQVQTEGLTDHRGVSLRLSDRRRRRRRRLLLRELFAELGDLARRRRELRSQAAKAGGGGDHRRLCRQYFSLWWRRRPARRYLRIIESDIHIRETRSHDRVICSAPLAAQRAQMPFFCVIFLLFCDQNHSIPWPSNSTSKQVKLANY